MIPDMNNNLIPLEIWEHIIDSCRVQTHEYGLRRSYRTWRQTALVCSAWLPRSRLNLLYDVELRHASDVYLLLRTLQEAPHLADLVVRLAVGHMEQYVPFAWMPLPLLLKKCVALSLPYTDWAEVYSPRHPDGFLYPWSGRIVELRLHISGSTLRTMVRLIWSMHQLQDLYLWWTENTARLTRTPMVWPGLKAGKCQSLRSLVFENVKCALALWPANVFGCAVKSLELDVGQGVSGNTLQCIESFGDLEHLRVYCRLGLFRVRSTSVPRARPLPSVLGSVRSGSALRSVMVHVLRPTWLVMHSDSYYGVDRAGLLDLLLGEEILEILSRFPQLRLLHFSFWENNEEYDAEWWTAQMVSRLPGRCHAAVSVDLRLHTDCKQLWQTREEVEAAKRAEEEADRQAYETQWWRALYEDEVLLADVGRMFNQGSYGLSGEKAASEQRAGSPNWVEEETDM